MLDTANNKLDFDELEPVDGAGSVESGKALVKQLWQNPTEMRSAWNKLRDAVRNSLPVQFAGLEISETPKQTKNGIVPGSDKDTYINYQNGLEQKMRFMDGTERTFRRDNPAIPNEITGLEIKYPNQPVINLKKVDGKENTFTDGKNTWNVRYETKNGEFIAEDFRRGSIRTQTIDGTVRELDTKTGIETTSRDGVINEIKDPKRNYLWQRQDGDNWQAVALDTSKDFKAPSEHITGKAEKFSNGDYSFTGKDNIRNRFRADGSEDKPGSMVDLKEKIENSKILDSKQKERLLKDYLPKFAERQFVGKNIDESNRERNEAIFQLSRLLEKPEPGAYTDLERGKILEQTAFHFANPTNFQQALKTCNVTDIGICFLHESPSQLAKVMAEVGTTGTYKTLDGSVIEPPRGDIQTALRDQAFPLHETDPGASGVSRAFGIIAANIHWQRRTKDFAGQIGPKGSIKYQQAQGEGVFRHQNGQRYHTYNNEGAVIDNPGLTGEDLIDIAQQITGDNWKNRIINSADNIKSYTPSNHEKGAELRKSIASIEKVEDLHKAFLANHTQIAMIHTGNPPFYYDSGYGNEVGAGGLKGGWHVVVKTKYEPVYDASGRMDPEKSKVYFDNTWNPNRADRLTTETAVSLAQMYTALKEPKVPTPAPVAVRPAYVNLYNQAGTSGTRRGRR